MNSNYFNNVPKACALLAAALVLPALAYAKDIKFEKWDKDATEGKGDKWDGEKGHKGDKGDPRVVAAPEPNTAWVLVPFMGAFLLVSARHLARRKVTQ